MKCAAIREAATERLLDVASIEEDEWPNRVARVKDWIIWRLVYAGNGAHAAPFFASACSSCTLPPVLFSLYQAQQRSLH